MARTPFRFVTPDTRLRHIKFARDREEERKGRLDEMDARRQMQIDQQMQRETQRSADLDQRDSIQEQMQVETRRKADLDRREAEQPRGLGMRGRYQKGMPLGPAVPGPREMPLGRGTYLQPGETQPPLTTTESRFFGVPEPTEEPPFRESEIGLLQKRAESLLAPGEHTVSDWPHELEELVEKRRLGNTYSFQHIIRGEDLTPDQAWAIAQKEHKLRALEQRALEQPLTGLVPGRGTFAGAAAVKGTLGVAEAVDYPRRWGKENIIEPVLPDFDITIPKEVFQATGQPMAEDVTITDEFVAEAASWILDPINVFPGIGFGPELMRAAKLGPKALGAALKNPKARAFLDDAMRGIREAGEAGGPRVPGVGPEDVARVTPPEPPRLPTIAETKARAKALPPETRAQMMGEIAEPDIPLQSWDDFHAQWGPRYQENAWTKFEDTVGGPLARTPEEKAVRSAFVRGDLYREIQTTRARSLVWNWVGKHRAVLRLNSQGVAKAIKPRPGVDIPKKLMQRLEHITEHPEKYIIAPEQQAALDEAQNLFQHVLQTELREGVDVLEVMGGYWRRLVKRIPSGKSVDATSGLAMPRVKPAHARSRAFGDIEALAAWDVQAGGKLKLGSAIDGMADRLTAATDAIANRRIVNELRNLGIKPSERISAEIADEARAATQAYKEARAAATRKGATLAERSAATEAEVRLVNAQRSLKAEAKFAMERRPKVLGRLVTDEAAEQMARYLDAAGPGAIDEAFRLARASNIVGDLSAMGIQGWYTFWTAHPTWWQATFKSLEALVRNPYRYAVQNVDVIERGTRVGAIVAPEEFLLRRGGRWSQRFVQLPIIRNTQNAFEWWTFVAQTERWRAIEGLARNPEDLFELAGVLRNQTGVSLMPGLTKMQRRGAQAFFAPKFLAALLGSVKDVTRPGAAGAYARRTVATAFGGAMAGIVAGNIAQGKVPNLIDPDKAGFFAIPVDKGYLYPMGPFQPFVVALFRSGRAVQDLAQDETPRPRDLQAWPRFIEGKLNKYERALVRAAEALGLPIGEVRGRPFRGPEVGRGRAGLWGEAEQFGPIGPVQAARGIAEGAPITGLEVGGIRTTVRTPYQTLQQGWGQEYPDQKFNVEVDYIVAEVNPDLAPLVEAARERSLDYGTPSAVMRQENLRVRADLEERYELGNLASDFLAGNEEVAPQLMERYRNYKGDVAVAISAKMLEVERKPETPEGKALQAYGELNPYDAKYVDPRTKEPDWDLFREDQDKHLLVIRRLYPELADALETRLKTLDGNLRAVEPRLEEALDTRGTLFEMERWTGVGADKQKQIENLQDLVAQFRARLGLTGPVAHQQYITVAAENGIKDGMITLAHYLRPGSSGDTERANSDYIKWLLAHKQQLPLFFPELYQARALLATLPEDVKEVVIQAAIP